MKSVHQVAESIVPGAGIVVHPSTIPEAARQDAQVATFLATMPERYRREFDEVSFRQHARIAGARRKRRIHADRFVESAGTVGICVVATDAQGLLAVISTGLMLEGFDITRADAYTRPAASGENEAFDLFWVRRSRPDPATPIGHADVVAIRATLRELLTTGNARLRLHLACSGAACAASDTRVSFREPPDAPWLTLELESDDRPGLLALVTGAMAAENIQIVHSRIRTLGARVHDEFDLLEADGTRPTGTRLQRLQLTLFTAIESPSGAAFWASPLRWASWDESARSLPGERWLCDHRSPPARRSRSS